LIKNQLLDAIFLKVGIVVKSSRIRHEKRAYKSM